MSLRKYDPAYGCWKKMRDRCNNKASDHYSRYGARGITVCARWDSFEAFLEDMGPRPSKEHSIDRVDVFGNYEPSNCRWATRKQQARNRAKHITTTINGKTVLAVDLAESIGIKADTIYKRIVNGWSEQDILRLPTKVQRGSPLLAKGVAKYLQKLKKRKKARHTAMEVA